MGRRCHGHKTLVSKDRTNHQLSMPTDTDETGCVTSSQCTHVDTYHKHAVTPDPTSVLGVHTENVRKMCRGSWVSLDLNQPDTLLSVPTRRLAGTCLENLWPLPPRTVPIGLRPRASDVVLLESVGSRRVSQPGSKRGWKTTWSWGWYKFHGVRGPERQENRGFRE